MRTRAGTTIVELMFAVAIGLIVILIAYNAMHLMVVGEKTTDREASRALAEALLMETLMQDLRSARKVTPQGANGYQIERYVAAGGKLKEQPITVTWEMVEGPKVKRQVPGERPQIFDFSKMINPGDPPFKFQLEKVPDVVFQP